LSEEDFCTISPLARYKRPIQRKPSYRANERIWAQKVRLVGADGKQIGIVSREKMLAAAREADLDAVEVVATANPPVVKLIDFNKFKYQEEKKERETRRKERKASEQKEVRFSPFIGEGDFEVRLGRIKEFLGDGHKIRVVVQFKGRQMAKRQFGYDLITKLMGKLEGRGKIDQKPKFLGRRLVTVISPDSGGKTDGKKEEDQKQAKDEKIGKSAV